MIRPVALSLTALVVILSLVLVPSFAASTQPQRPAATQEETTVEFSDEDWDAVPATLPNAETNTAPQFDFVISE